MPRLKKKGWMDKTFYLSELDEKTRIDYDYVSWLNSHYRLNSEIDYGIVQPTVKSMTEQMKKFGADPLGQPDPKIWELACKATREEYSALIGECAFTRFEDVELNMEANCGIPFNKFYEKKGDAINGAHDLLKWFVTDGWKTAGDQYVKLTGKVERLSKEDIENKKCRAFQPDPLQVIIFEAMLNQDLTKKFKELTSTMSAYGFNKWNGGWDALFREFDHYKRKFAGDVSRWDKYYQKYHHDANTALKKEFIRPDHRELFQTDERFDWINEHAKNLNILLWTGDVVQLEQGQGSGRFTTTLDNILSHTRVLYYHYFRVREVYEQFELPTRVLEIKSIYNCKAFGDDSFGATELTKLSDFRERKESYRQCGFELKAEGDFESESLIGLPFLGAKNGVYRGRNVFVMDPKRMHGSLCTLLRSMSSIERYERTYQIFLNCIFTFDHYPGTDTPVVEVLYQRVKHLRSQLPDSELGAYGNILGLSAYRNFILGLESNNKILKILEIPRLLSIGSRFARSKKQSSNVPFFTVAPAFPGETRLNQLSPLADNFRSHKFITRMARVIKDAMSDVKGKSISDKKLLAKAVALKRQRELSESRRAARSSARAGQDAARARPSPQGSTRGTTSNEKNNRKGGNNLKANSFIDLTGRSGIPATGGELRALAAKLDTPRLTAKSPQKAIKLEKVEGNIVKARKYREQPGSHPYKLEEHGEHPENIPIVRSKPTNGLRDEIHTTMESVMTPYGPGVKLRGREYLNTLDSGATTYTMGNGIVGFIMNPRLLQLPRINTLAKLYTRYIFNRFDVHYGPTAGTFNNGSLQIFGVYDPTVNPCVRPGEALISYSTERFAKDFQISQNTMLRMDDSNFKDLLYLEADDDLRWTMQGVVFAISAGSINSTLELGKLILDYEVTLANDDLEDEEQLQQRSYKNLTLTVRNTTDAVNAGFQIASASAIPRGKYWVTVRSSPTNTVNFWQDQDAMDQVNALRTFPVTKGFSCYASVKYGTGGDLNFPQFSFYYGPDLWGESNGSKVMYNNGAITAGTTMTVDVWRYSDD